MLIHGTLDDIRDKVKQARITRTALILVGRVLEGSDFRSRMLYDETHHHVLRPRR